ncbi:hypothetical protein SISNIDRAFT_492128, partial [Sistotremastrum niveocremeum HHB9708]
MANQAHHPQYYGPPIYAQPPPPAQVQHTVANALSAFDQMFGAPSLSTVDIRSTRGTFVLLHSNCDICTRYAQHLTGLQLSTENYSTDSWRNLLDHLQRAFPGLEQYVTRTASQNYEDRIRSAVESRQRAITDLNRRHDEEIDALRRTIDRLRDDLRVADRALANADSHIQRLERRRHSPPPTSQKRRRSRSPTPLPRPPLASRLRTTPRPARLEDRIASRSPKPRSPTPDMSVDEPTTPPAMQLDHPIDSVPNNGTSTDRLPQVPPHPHLHPDLQWTITNWAHQPSAIYRGVRDAEDGIHLNADDIAIVRWLQRVCTRDPKKHPVRNNILRALANPDFIARSDLALAARHLQPPPPLTPEQIERPEGA